MTPTKTLSLLALCGVSFLACGGSNDGASALTGPSGSAGGAGGSGAAGGVNAGGATATGGAAAVGGASGLGGAAGSGGPSLAPIDPLVVGSSWTYDVTELGTYPLCPSGSHTGSVVSKGAKDGKPEAFGVKSLCENAGVLYYAVEGDLVQYDAMGTWVIALDAPVKEGHAWSTGAATLTWHDAGAVTVPAGTFDSCWKAAADGSEAYTIFCRGVGPVRWHVIDASGNGYDAVLTAKNF